MFSQKSQRGSGVPRFHSHGGLNIRFESKNQTAIRTTSFANAITFSEKPLAPGEIFLIEIEETESGWSGHMRIGLTQLDPNTGFELPLYALPDLVSMGPCWLYAVTKRHNTSEGRYDQFQVDQAALRLAHPQDERPSEEEEESDESEDELGRWLGDLAVFENNPSIATLPNQPHANIPVPPRGEENDDENAVNADTQRRVNSEQVLRREGDVTWTPCGFIQHRALTGQRQLGTEGRRDGQQVPSYQLPTDVGSRIGVMFIPTGHNTANMHFIINGEDQGPSSRDIPYLDAPVYAVVDVYGSTKRVRTCQIYGVDSLQSLCRDSILEGIQLSGVGNLPLPKLLKNYLLFH